MDENSWLDRQENEKAALKAIYGSQLIDVSHSSQGKWEPLECKLLLGPQPSSRIKTDNDPSVELNIICPYKYPDEVPQIQLTNWKKISNVSMTVLLEQLNDLAFRLKGEVMIFELATHVENFLHESIQHGYESFYEEMILRNKEKKEKEIKEKKRSEERRREEILQQIQNEQQAVKRALRRRSVSKSEKEKNNVQESCNEETGFHEQEIPIIQTPNANITNDSEEFTRLYMSARPGQTRFENEFEHIKWIGKGAYGDVLKVRNRLDDGFYAIKRIQLNASNRQLNKKIVREVKLLSRLNHENVVRYYNSWIEHGGTKGEDGIVDDDEDDDDDDDDDKDEDDDDDKKDSNDNGCDENQANKDVKVTIDLVPQVEDISLEWSEKTEDESSEDSEDDWIDFRSKSNSNHELSQSRSTTEKKRGCKTLFFYYLYIQMELCEKSTLRISIDGGLYKEVDRGWRLLREIIEGLCHIHQQGIIHRDLKPVNIFIGHDDHVKIGDFGLATSNTLQKPGIPKDIIVGSNELMDGCSIHSVLSHTGQVGTTYYVAPELNDSFSRTNYNQKVDIYSLGIIFFEMCHPPFKTSMERYKILMDLRQSNITFPDEFIYDCDSKQRRLISWMLNHDVNVRPNSQDLLQSDYIPPPKLEEAEVKEMVRRTLSNPQSKDYKYLVASCFHQVMQPALDATFNISSWRSTTFIYCLEFACQKIKEVFQQHGAISFLPPLLTPAHPPVPESAVCLMTRLGGIVCATYDLRTPFSRYLVQNPHVNHLKRYAIDKVFREKPAGIHPKEVYECSFDIVTPTPGNLMPELELLSVVWEILNEFPSLLQRNCILYLNHSSLISSMLKHSGLDEIKHKQLCEQIFNAKEITRSKVDFGTQLRSLPLSEFSVGSLLNWMDIEGTLNKVETELGEILIDHQLISKCKTAFQQLHRIIQNCEILGLTCPTLVNLGLVTSAQNYSGLIFQIVCDQKSRVRRYDNNVIITGGRYDKLLSELRHATPFADIKSNQSVCGFTLYFDKLVALLSGQEKVAVIDVLICTLGNIQMNLDRIKLMKDLWRSGIRTLFVNTMETLDEIHAFCQDQHIPVIVLLKDTEATYARVKTVVRDKNMPLAKDKYVEKKVPCNDLIDYLMKNVHKTHESLTLTKCDTRNYKSDALNITITSTEKVNPSTKRRYESQISNSMSSILQRFSSKVRVEVVAVSLETEALKVFSNCLDLSTGHHDITSFLKRFPRYKKYTNKIIDVIDEIRRQHHILAIVLYSLSDNTYKINM